jgi:hypothetical protein
LGPAIFANGKVSKPPIEEVMTPMSVVEEKEANQSTPNEPETPLVEANA